MTVLAAVLPVAFGFALGVALAAALAVAPRPAACRRRQTLAVQQGQDPRLAFVPQALRYALESLCIRLAACPCRGHGMDIPGFGCVS